MLNYATHVGPVAGVLAFALPVVDFVGRDTPAYVQLRSCEYADGRGRPCTKQLGVDRGDKDLSP